MRTFLIENMWKDYSESVVSKVCHPESLQHKQRMGDFHMGAIAALTILSEIKSRPSLITVEEAMDDMLESCYKKVTPPKT